MRRVAKLLFSVAAAVLYLVVVLLALEVFARCREQVVLKRGQQYSCTLRAREKDACDAVVRRYTGAPLDALQNDIPTRSQFQDLDEAGRAAFAKRRRELVVVCKPDSRVESVYVGSQPSTSSADLAVLAEKIKSKGDLVGLTLASGDGATPQTCIAEAMKPSGTGVNHDFLVPFPDGTPHFFDFFFSFRRAGFGKTGPLDGFGKTGPLDGLGKTGPLDGLGKTGPPEGAVVFVGNPVWESRWFKFRKNVRLELATGEGVWESDTVRFSTNNVGFRGADVALPKPPGVYRIICVGGSTTVEGLTDELTYPHMLERKLRDYFKTEKIEVVNCGVYGLTSNQERQRLRDYLDLEPDLIIYYNFINDLRQALPVLADPLGDGSKFYLGSSAGEQGARTGVIKRIQHDLRYSKLAFYVLNDCLLAPVSEIADYYQKDTLESLRLLNDAARKRHASVAVCSFAYPDFAHLSREDRWFFEMGIMQWFKLITMPTHCGMVNLFNSMARDLCEDQGMIYVPVAENLKGGTNYFTDICHLNPVGIDRKAQIVFDSLKDYIAGQLKKHGGLNQK